MHQREIVSQRLMGIYILLWNSRPFLCHLQLIIPKIPKLPKFSLPPEPWQPVENGIVYGCLQNKAFLAFIKLVLGSWWTHECSAQVQHHDVATKWRQPARQRNRRPTRETSATAAFVEALHRKYGIFFFFRGSLLGAYSWCACFDASWGGTSIVSS